MPLKIRKRDNKWRLYEGRKLARNAYGTPIDGGGHSSRAKALRQLRAINISKHRIRKCPVMRIIRGG